MGKLCSIEPRFDLDNPNIFSCGKLSAETILSCFVDGGKADVKITNQWSVVVLIHGCLFCVPFLESSNLRNPV